ncbi:MAG TPA: RnfABCDGE type electron transport complex subunit E [candidate division WOR-3 bacterium]|uniref:Ion-translocating oxidoreductase complex subunit E n=1 Tax=candidate division WOR-3 bacterium TaxID=2052148 RepID=A0A7V0T7P7_UNCW3|nr:RnfABCDGE type electron transport complex subunit E [candidate division WOR-3 bacterium]
MKLKYFTSGIVKENPLLILMIGLCPALATTVSARDGFGMGIAASFVLIASNLVVSLIRRYVPNSIRIPIFIIIISTFVTIIDYVLQAYQPALYSVLGVFVPLIVVNCLILGRAEAFAYHHGVWDSFLDGAGKAVGFTLVLGLMGIIRELFAAGTVFGVAVTPAGYREQPMLFMVFAPGAFLLIGILKSIVNRLTAGKARS